jgi:hypothetical protein
MIVQGFKAVAHQNHQRVGVIPFRVEPELDASDITQLSDVDLRVKLATKANRMLSYYENIANLAVEQDDRPADLNGQRGKVGLLHVGADGKDFKTYTEFEVREDRLSQPINQAQIRWHGYDTHVPDNFTMKSEANGARTLEMFDPSGKARITLTVGASGSLDIGIR